jgi:hypothetical protein
LSLDRGTHATYKLVKKRDYLIPNLTNKNSIINKSMIFFLVQKAKKLEKKYVPQASARRARFNPAGGMAIEE